MEGISQQLKILFFGDSICVGQGISIHKGCVALISAHLEENRSTFGKNILVINSSVNGRTSRQALEDMPYHVQNQSPDILVIQYGLNDCNHWVTDRGLPRVSLDAFKGNLKEIIHRGKKFGAKQVILNNNHPTTLDQENIPDTEFTFEHFNKKYNEATRKLATEMQEEVTFLDIESHFLQLVKKGKKMSDFLLEDGLHLGESGHQIYFELVNPVIENAIKDF